MKSIKLKPLNLLFNIAVLAILFIALGVTPSIAAPAAAITGTATGIALGYHNPFAKVALHMAIQREIWENTIENAIFKDNKFIEYAVNADEYVLQGRVVHKPQSGGPGNVQKNRTTLPAAIRQRTDVDVLYVLDEYTSDPVLIRNADTAELSYDKRTSVLGEDLQNIIQNVAENMLYNWTHSPQDPTSVIPGASFIGTSGAATAATAPSATGNVKAASLNDLQAAATFLRNQNRWFEGQMYAMLTPNMLAQMFPADSLTTATYMNQVTEQERRAGIMFKAQGFNIMTRSSVFYIDSTGAIKAPGTAGASTDVEGGLFWWQGAVERAKGDVKMFEQLGVPTMYGDVYSMLVRMGGRACRTNYEGMTVLKQTPTA